MAVRNKIVAILIVLIFSCLPTAVESAFIPESLFEPDHIRITNQYSEMSDFVSAEKNITSLMKNWSIKGASVAIAKDGKLVYAKGFGVTDTISNEPVQPYNRFRIASISKLVTAVAIMKLCENGKLSLSDKVFGPDAILNDSIYLNAKDKRAYSITVAHLLTHEGGWTQVYGDQMFMPVVIANEMHEDLPIDLQTIVRFALSKRMHFTPGTSRSYSNLGYSILGLVIEKVTGMSYEDYCKINILAPLGIFDMEIAHNLQEEKAPFEVSYYTPSNIEFKPSIYGTGEMLNPAYGGNDIEALGAAGAWIATPTDLMKLMLAIDGIDTTPDILSEESITYMTSYFEGNAPVGWTSVAMNGTWSRTGSFPGTEGLMKRLPDGFDYVILFNTSSWIGPQLHNYVSTSMSRFLRQVKNWPEDNLFEYDTPVPLLADVIAQVVR